MAIMYDDVTLYALIATDDLGSYFEIIRWNQLIECLTVHAMPWYGYCEIRFSILGFLHFHLHDLDGFQC